LKQIVLDAAPVIALFYAKDTYHSLCVEGFTQLSQSRTILLTPLPIVFEVYKWLLQRTTPQVAQNTLKTMEESLHFITMDDAMYLEVQSLVFSLPQWRGSLEDATVAITAIRYRCPIWTLNFRDFSIFKNIEFWNPVPNK
jgi:predicted nucleic acid-binding protein